jgi:hypothetical protein
VKTTDSIQGGSNISGTLSKLHCHICGVSELRVKAKSRNKFKDLIQKMKEVMGSLARDTLAKVCTSFRSRSENLFTADGSFIEYVDCQYVSLLIVFYFNKIGQFSAVLCHLKERRKKFRIAATLYS